MYKEFLLTGEEKRYEVYFDKLGKWFGYSLYKPYKDNISIMFRDITESLISKQRMKLLNRAIEQSPGMVIITDTNGNIEYVNPKTISITGYELSELKGKNVSDMLSADPSKSTSLLDILNTISSSEEWKGEFLNKKKNGELYWASASITAIRDENGAITNYISTQEDTTEKKELYIKLEESNVQLKLLVKELKETQRKLVQQEKMAGIGQLAEGVAHEINNPLAYVISNFDMLENFIVKLKDMEKYYKELLKGNCIQSNIEYLRNFWKKNKMDFIFSDIDDLFEDTNEGLVRIGKIVKALRMYSREGREEEFNHYDLNKSIENILLMMNSEIKYHAKIVKKLSELPLVYASEDEVNQVLMNIINNALYAIKAKKSEDLGTIIISTYTEQGHVFITIEDNGIGITEENINKIFDPFFTTKQVGEGTGLGLSICYDIIVNKHQGEIYVESKLNKGTKFIIKL